MKQPKLAAKTLLRSRTAAAPARASSVAIDPPITQPVANPIRGEHELTLAGVNYRLRPSRAAINAIEAKTGHSMIQLITLGNAGAMPLVTIGTVARELIHAGADDDLTRMISAERIEELVYEQGVGRPTARLTMCLLDAANGGRTSSGNVKAAAG